MHVCRFSHILSYLSATDLHQLEAEFLEYQLLEENDIPEHIWESALVVDSDDAQYHRMDVLWNFLRMKRNPTNGILMFQKLSSVALLVLTLPHSNAEEERVFSMINKNKTKFRPNLVIDATLSSLITVKLANEGNCSKYEPPKEVLESAKKATMEYNRAHSKK